MPKNNFQFTMQLCVIFWLQGNDTSSHGTAGNDKTAPHLSHTGTSGVSRAEQETLDTYKSRTVSSVLQPNVSSFRGGDTGYCATNTTGDNPPNSATAEDEEHPSTSENEDNADAPTEDPNEPSRPSPGDAVVHPRHTPPNTANGRTPSSQSDEPFRPTVKPVAAKHATSVGLKADKNQGNFPARGNDLHGKSNAPQHATIAAKGGPVTSHQLHVGKGELESEEAIDQHLEGPRKTPAMVEQPVKMPGEGHKEACLEKTMMEKATVGRHAFRLPRSPDFSETANISSEAMMLPISGGPSNITVFNTMCMVAIDPHDRHE